jgi:thioesterase domain-containing protein
MGEEVPLVVLIDSYAPAAIISKKSQEYWFKKLSSVYTRLKKHPTRHKPAFLLNELKKVFVYSYKKLLFNKEEEYVPTPYPGKVVLFKSSDPGPVFTEDSQMGWSNFLTGEKEIITIEGDHVDILKEPAVIEFAEKLTKVFNQVNRPNSQDL